jgi:hypothetical protein
MQHALWHNEPGFPLACLSAEYNTGQYFYDLEQQKQAQSSAGWRTFFAGRWSCAGRKHLA